MIDRDLLLKATDRDGLANVLRALDWPVDPEYDFEIEPEIAQGVTGGSQVKVYRLVPAGEDDERLIILAEFEQKYVRRDLRELLRSLRQHIRETGRFDHYSGLQDTIFIVAAPGYEDVRFVLFEEQDRRLPRIRSFGWQYKFIGRTVLTHNLERLRWNDRAKWESAWDVEGLTEDFYRSYEVVFNTVSAQVVGAKNEKQAHAWTQQLFNRLLFVAFIQRMGWLRAPEGSSDGYLFDLWRRHQDQRAKPRDYPDSFNGVLDLLWFSGLNSPNGNGGQSALFPILGEVPYLNGGLFSPDPELDVSSITVPDRVFVEVLSESSGLFARYNFTVTESTPLDQEVAVDPEMLGKIFERLIIKAERHSSGSYYTPRPIVEFMVNEAIKGYLTDRGLAADKAAMLVDEDRVEPPLPLGAKDACPAIGESKFGEREGEGAGGWGSAQLPSATLAFLPSELQDTLDWLFEVRAVDPACGSGAFLLMLLQRLFDLVDRLEVSRDRRRNVKQEHLYETKLRLLQRCVYGVDLSETAVRLARLRLWLSLVVENRGEKPEPLPNFDFLIMQGDSLASPLFPAQNVLGYPEAEIREYTRMKGRYFHPKAGEQRPTREEMKDQREKISLAFSDELSRSNLRSLSPMSFDWEVEFPEVFDPQDSEDTLGGRLNLGPEAGRKGQGELASQSRKPPGFDIVLANPPYVRQEELKRTMGDAYKKSLAASYPNSGSGTADLLIYFYDRALQLLKLGGTLAFITSKQWLKAGYGEKLRGHMAKKARIQDIIDFGELPVFQGVATFPMILIAQKSDLDGKPQSTTFTSVKSLDEPYPDVNALVVQVGNLLPVDAIDGTDWTLADAETLARLRQMKAVGTALEKYVNGKIFRGILTGLNEAFVIDGAKRSELIAEDPRSAEIIKPLAVGDDVRKWHIRDKGRWLIFTRRGIDIDSYPAIKRHLLQFQIQLEPRPADWKPTPGQPKWPGRKEGRYKWFEIQDDIAYYAEFSNPKILFPDIAKESRFTFDLNGNSCLNTTYFISKHDLYLMGVLSSGVAWWYFTHKLTPIGDAQDDGRLRFFRDKVEDYPVPPVSEQDRLIIESHVQQILNLHQQLTSQLAGSGTSRRTAPGVIASESKTPEGGRLIKIQVNEQLTVSDGQEPGSPQPVLSTEEIEARVKELEAEIDARVEFLYFHQDEAPTYDEWIEKRAAESGTILEEIRKLIASTEHHHLEFKSSVIWNVKADKHDLTMRDEVLKEVCAFLNADGGTVLCGVEEKSDGTGSLLGIGKDVKHQGNIEKLCRVISNAMGDLVRPDPAELVKIDSAIVDGHDVIRIRVSSDRAHMYQSPAIPKGQTPGGKPTTHVRINGEAKALEGQALINWWERRRDGS